MKNRFIVKLLCLVLCAVAFLCLGVACSSKEPDNDDPVNNNSGIENVVKKENIQVSYNEESGVVSWTKVKDATKYVVVINLRHHDGVVTTYETVNLSQQLSLQQGLNLITVYAYKDKTEIGIGAITAELSLDFVHPGTPDNLIYNKAENKLSWDAAENATKYKITVTGITDADYIYEGETAQTNQEILLPGGVYNISVVAVNSQGSSGASAEIEYATYTSAKFDTDEDNDGVFDLFDFNSAAAADIVYSGEYKEWQSAVSSAAEYKIVDRATFGDYTEGSDGALLIYAPSQDVGRMCGITVRLPKDLSVGVLSLDLYRADGATTGLALSDGKGHTAYYAISDGQTAWRSWKTVSVNISEFLENNSDLECVREIGVYQRSTKAGSHYIDNLRYERLGDVGNVAYDVETKTLSWDSVFGANEYVVKQGSNELYRGNATSVVLEEALDNDEILSCTLTIEAIAEGTSKSKDCVLNFFGDIGDIVMDEQTLLVTWDAVVGATKYTLTLNGNKVYEGTETQYQVTRSEAAEQDWTAELVATRGETSKTKKATVLCIHGNNQLFGTLKDGSENEHYIAEWHNAKAWGQFKTGGYTGGPENGITFVYGDWVYDDYDTQTRIKDDCLHIESGAGWGNGIFGVKLPTTLKLSEISSIKIKLKLADTSKSVVYYFNEGKYYLGANGATVSEADEDGYKTYTIDVSKFSSLEGANKTTVSIDELSVIGVSSNAAYSMDIKEITYVEALNTVSQKFGEVKDEATNEYYFADFTNPEAWGQFSAAGYSGGPANGITFVYGDWVYDDYDTQTRIKDGYLHIESGAGWGNGIFGVKLPQTVSVSEISSIKIKLKLADASKSVVYYFNEGKYYLGANGATVSEADEDGYKTYTIDVSKLASLEGANKTTVSLDELSIIGLSSNAAYTMYVKEITYIKAN